MAPIPALMLKEIKDFHPGLTEDELHQYALLVYLISDAISQNSPDEFEKAKKEMDAYVEKYLPHLNEAMESYEKKVDQRFKEITAKDPVDIALASPPVIKWMAKNLKGKQYTTGSHKTEEPSRYIVELKSPEGPELHVVVDIYSHDSSIIFQRIKTDKAGK